MSVAALPHLFPQKLLLINQDPHQLRDSHGRVSVIQLDGNLYAQNITICQYRISIQNRVLRRHCSFQTFSSDTVKPTYSPFYTVTGAI